MKLSHRNLIIFAGAVWIAIGFFLLNLGINFTMENLQSNIQDQDWSIFSFCHYLAGTAESTTAIIIILAIAIGHIKGRLVLKKAAIKNCNRIVLLPNPSNITKIYPPALYSIIFLMMGLGMFLSWIKPPLTVRGFVDIAVGAALIQGSLTYFRFRT